MRFISVKDDYTLVIHQGTQQLLAGAGGINYPVQILPHLTAEFGRAIVPYAEREAARVHFDDLGRSDNGEEPGAYRRAGIFADEELAGLTYMGQPREHYYGVFDTADAPSEMRALYEAVLTGDAEACVAESKKLNLLPRANPSTDLGHTYIRVDQVSEALKTQPPWPGYDDFKGAGGFKDLIGFAKQGRIPIEALLEYERSKGDDARPSYVSAFEQAIEERGPLGPGQTLVTVIPG